MQAVYRKLGFVREPVWIQLETRLRESDQQRAIGLLSQLSPPVAPPFAPPFVPRTRRPGSPADRAWNPPTFTN